MKTNQTNAWVLPVLAHIAILVASPFWALIIVFSPLLLTEYVGLQTILILAIYLSVPITTILLLLGLWWALLNHNVKIIRRLSYVIIFAQLTLFLFLLL